MKDILLQDLLRILNGEFTLEHVDPVDFEYNPEELQAWYNVVSSNKLSREELLTRTDIFDDYDIIVTSIDIENRIIYINI